MRVNQLQDPTDALLYFVDFAQQDLAAATPRQLRETALQMEAFLRREERGHYIAGTPLNLKWLRVMQGRALGVLKGFASGTRFAIAGDLLLSFYGMPEEGKTRIRAYGDPVARMLYIAMRVIESVGAEKILTCPACGRLFLKVTKKKYCSARCQSRVYMQKYRRGEVGEK
jgi:uncharacterized C2H2 Zn-finger protein